MTRLRVACLGGGFIAGRHLAALSGFADVQIAAVADTAPERAAETAERYRARPYTDPLALLAAEDLDALWICVPPFAHGPLEAAALARRLPFLVEKPPAADLATARAIGREVAAAGLPVAVGYHWRHLSLVQRAAALLAGTPARLLTGAWLDSTPPPPWWARRTRSGGQLVEQATHVFDLFRLLAGEVAAVTALERPADDGAGGDAVPSAAAVLLAFESGAIGTVAAARVLGHRHRTGVEVVADGRVVEFLEWAPDDHELRVSGVGEEHLRSAEDPMAAEDRQFLDVVAGRAPRVAVPYAEALRTHALAWAADLAARTGTTVRPADLLAEAVRA